jgi:hypothetical protein
MTKKLDWYSMKYKKPKQRKPYARSTDIHEDKRRYDRSKDKRISKKIIEEHM